MPQLAAQIWADGPFSAPFHPPKPDIRAWGTWIEGIIASFLGNGGLIYSSLSSLNADLAHAANTMAWVYGDATVANNGIYGKVGGSGSGSWTRRSDLPFSFIIANDAGAGTPNAIQATTSIPVSESALVWMNIADTNVGTPVTVSFNGGAALTIKTNAGNNPAVGGLVAGTIVMGIKSGSTFRLVSDQASAAILAGAEAAQAAAESAQVIAEAAAAALPSLSGNASKFLKVKADETGYDMRTAAQVASDISAVTLVSSGISLSAATAANDFNHGHFGGNFNSSKALHVLALDKAATDAGTGPRFAAAITSDVAGGHANGPDSTRGALWLMAGKKSYLTTAETGEIDAVYILVQQGNQDDGGGIIIDATKVFDTGTSGGLTPIELVGKRVNTAGATLSAVHAVIGFQEGAGGALNAGGASFYAENYTNANNQGFVSVNYTAAFDRAFAAYNSRSHADDYFGVYYDGNANLQLGSRSDNIHLVYDFAADAMYWRDNTGSSNLLTLLKTGVLTSLLGVQVSPTSSILKKVLRQKSSVSFGTILANSANTVDVTVTGAAVDDMVHVNMTANYSGDTEIVTGRVLSANTVRLSANNNGTSSLVTSAQDAIIWVFGA